MRRVLCVLLLWSGLVSAQEVKHFPTPFAVPVKAPVIQPLLPDLVKPSKKIVLGPSPVVAEKQVKLSFDRIGVIDFLTLIYGDILRQNFAIDDKVLKDEQVLTVHFQSGFDEAKIQNFVDALLSDYGMVAERRKGYVYVRGKDLSEVDNEYLVYRPKFRSVDYLAELVASVMRPGRERLQVRALPGVPGAPGVGGDVPYSEPVPQSVKSSAAQVGGTSGKQSGFRMRSGGNERDVYIYAGTSREIEKVSKLLAAVDTSPGQVMVKAVVFEVVDTSNSGSAVGLALSILKGRIGFSFGSLKSAGDAVFARARGGDGSSLDAVFSVLSSDSRFRSLSNPSLRVVSGGSAQFSVGSDVPVLGAVQFDKNGNAIQSVEYRPSGVIFELQPNVRENEIELSIHQQLSSFIQTTTGVNTSPTLIKRELSTVVTSGLDDVIILGGLDEEKSSDDRAGSSLIPSWMVNSGGSTSKSQIVLVLNVTKI